LKFEGEIYTVVSFRSVGFGAYSTLRKQCLYIFSMYCYKKDNSVNWNFLEIRVTRFGRITIWTIWHSCLDACLFLFSFVLFCLESWTLQYWLAYLELPSSVPFVTTSRHNDRVVIVSFMHICTSVPKWFFWFWYFITQSHCMLHF